MFHCKYCKKYWPISYSGYHYVSYTHQQALKRNYPKRVLNLSVRRVQALPPLRTRKIKKIYNYDNTFINDPKSSRYEITNSRVTELIPNNMKADAEFLEACNELPCLFDLDF